MQTLNTVDYGVMGIYFAILVALALYLKRKASGSLEDYFLGGRNLPWWALGISGMASWLDVTGTSLIVAFLYMLGPRGLFIEFRGAVGLIMIFMLLWTGKWHRRSGCITGAEWMIYRFGDGVGGQFARLSAAVATVICTVGMLAFMIKGVGLFYSMFLPMTPLQCSLIMVGLATLYTIMSGFYGVVFTDMFQSVIIAAAVVVVAILAAGKVTDLTSMTATAHAVTGNPHWSSSALTWKATMPADYKQYEYLGWFVIFYLLRNVIGGIGAGGDPKYFGARNDRECGLLSFLWTWLMAFRWPLAMAFAVLGIFLVQGLFPDQTVLAEVSTLVQSHVPDVQAAQWADTLSQIIKYPDRYPAELIAGLEQLLGEDWTSQLHLVSFKGEVMVERILPAVILNCIPLGFRGLILVALVAASMSTFDSQLNAATGFFVRDIYQRYLRPQATNRELIRASYVFGILAVAAGFFMAYKATNINMIWEWVVMGLGGGFIIPTVLRFYWWRFNGGGFAISTLVGIVGAVLLWQLAPNMDGRWQFASLCGIGLVASIVGTYLTEPTDERILEHFYRTTRPFGLWGKRFQELLAPAEREQMRREHFYDVICVPFVGLWMVTLYLMPMQLIIRDFRSLGITAVLFAVALTAMYFLWYRHLPAAVTSADQTNGLLEHTPENE